MPERKVFTGAENRHNINRVPMENAAWYRLRAWCYNHDITMGEMTAMVLRDFMKRRKI